MSILPTNLNVAPELLDLLPAGVYVCDSEGRVTYYNRGAATLWGKKPSPDDAQEGFCGSPRFYRPDGRALPDAETPIAEVLRSGTPVRDREAIIERSDGSRFWALLNIDPVRDDEGRLAGAINVFIDITDKKKLSEQLSQSEERLRSLVAALPEAIYTTDHEGRITFYNEAAAQLWGRRPEIGEMWCGSFRILRLDGSPLPHDVCPMAIALKEARHVPGQEILVERPDGARRIVLPHPQPLFDTAGHLTGAVNMLLDVTERKRSEVERSLLAAIVESSDDAIVSKTLDGIITSWNKGAERILGYTAEEAIGQHISLIVPQERTDDVSLVLERIRRGERVDHYETKRRTKDGRIIDVSLTISSVRDASGKIVGASKVARDITMQKRTAEALQEADRRKDEFLAMLAHELRNPLSAISSAVQVARKSELDDPLEWSTEVIERQVRTLARLIDDLLDVSRITRGKIRLRKEVVDLRPLFNSATDTVRPLIEERKHKLSVSFGSGALRVQGDPVRLEQILVNLLTNAAKYTDSGGHIWLTAEQVEEEIVIQVRDSGMGIPPEQIPNMFELFVQGDRSFSRAEGGLGIGLTLVKRLVEMHQGSVTASSEGPGKGSVFTVRLPAAQTELPEAGQPASARGPSRRPSRILVVDDNADTARGLARLLKLLGHELQTATDGLEAVSIAPEFKPDVVLLDIGLPAMDGYEVARRLREIEACKETVIVAVSGYGQEQDRLRGREAGFNYHLVKPVDPDALAAVLSSK